MMLTRSQQDTVIFMEKEMIGGKKKDLTQSYFNMEICIILVLGCLEGILH